MNCLALLGSPRKDGNTAALLASFLDGAASKGHNVRTVLLQDRKILPCTSCNGCKKDGKGTGRCVLADDMAALYPAVLEAEVIVHAFPIYWWSMPAQTKLFQDRLYALDYGLFSGKKMYLLTTYGGEDPNSGPGIVERTFRDICDFLGMEFRGSLGVCSGSLPVQKNETALLQAKQMGTGI
ncbi:flavodoxin family protein [Aminivibrio sp.]|jgi:multimeric flavodoxin WrbA|uniref:flavodoxin family protein n=1 Tax=Aminivibrio sp. TaxID=1872489 RepID=UPI001A5411B4|nr:flavodoxin family protein [Aminivibrio sp.]MBL3538263.1 flavodoxin family protein [Aminivibrio sp.]MDK2959034.1 hypothetical protein [Synergistaceae bacterium]